MVLLFFTKYSYNEKTLKVIKMRKEINEKIDNKLDEIKLKKDKEINMVLSVLMYFSWNLLVGSEKFTEWGNNLLGKDIFNAITIIVNLFMFIYIFTTIYNKFSMPRFMLILFSSILLLIYFYITFFL
jgi:hypothetical protein